jgi:hypothetical protein
VANTLGESQQVAHLTVARLIAADCVAIEPAAIFASENASIYAAKYTTDHRRRVVLIDPGGAAHFLPSDSTDAPAPAR